MTRRQRWWWVVIALWALVGLWHTGRAEQLIAIDTPTSVPQTFTISGVAIDADRVDVWAFPPSHPNGLFFGSQPVWDRPDPVRQLPHGGFSILVTGAPEGSYPVTVYARHWQQPNTFIATTATYTVRACNWIVVCWPLLNGAGLTIATFLLTCGG